ncbi:MAG: exodeoxyribonuclease VII large subunit [Rhodoferax sp.]
MPDRVLWDAAVQSWNESDGDGGRERCWSVSALLQHADGLLGQHLGQVRVRAEIAGFVRASSGHCYFQLKDAQGQLRCALFRRAAVRMGWSPQEGQRVIATGRVTVYGPRGELQMVVETLQQEGEGDQFAQFLRLKSRLEQEGLFAAQRKRGLSRVPWAVAVVTSEDAAALADVAGALSRRAPHVQAVVFPCLVQGAGAPASIVGALQQAVLWTDHGCGVEMVLLVRGGGAWEDLHAYNDEGVARAIAACPVPVVCGVGHESDFTIADMVADVRAATPTAAAELCASAQESELGQLESLAWRLESAMARRLEYVARQADEHASRLAHSAHALSALHARLGPLERDLASSCVRGLQRLDRGLASLQGRLQVAGQRVIERQGWRLQGAGDKLSAVSPRHTLLRGFAYLRRGTEVVSSVSALEPEGRVEAILADGVVEMQVISARTHAFLE